ncbi:unnamed protein product [Spodoptera exigua]|nr:unnamed protein product [Spodoptera exigua]
MDLHRLRVVEFNTLVSEKEGRKKYTAELEEHKKKHKSSFDDKKYGTIQPENDSKCMEDKNRAQRIPQKIVGDGVNIKHLIDKIGPPGTSKQCLAEDQASRTPTSRISSFIKHKSKSEIFSIPSRCSEKAVPREGHGRQQWFHQGGEEEEKEKASLSEPVQYCIGRTQHVIASSRTENAVVRSARSKTSPREVPQKRVLAERCYLPPVSWPAT